MKKLFLFVALFVVPIVAYLFFASGVNSFIKLPTITEEVPELPITWNVVGDEQLALKNKITILGFTGTDFERIEGNMTNLAHKIYDRNKDFVDFQVVYIAPEGSESEIESFQQKLGHNLNLYRFYFVLAPVDEIKSYHSQLGLLGNLDSVYGTSQVYIIDKELNLRGRKGENKKGEEEYREGYNTISAADLHNEMSDDVKVILAEYRLALKKNNRIENVTE